MSQKLFVVYIASGDNTEVFRSLEDMPEPLRQKLVRVARNSHIDTLVIANEKGRELLESEGLNRRGSEPGPKVNPLSKGVRWAIACMLAGAVGLLMLAVMQFTQR
ncbi:MAG: hypothetical protein SFV51_32015 [Bryobacteraceae bacterium]|nr:hypothetical protein [Bryobacteraceae bacterium]